MQEKNRSGVDPRELRVAFFGDEAVEGLHIPPGERFFEKLPAKVGSYHLEYFACGIEGWGSYAAGLAWREMAAKYRFHLVVYVCSDDDFAGNLRGAARRIWLPQAVPSDQAPGFVTDPEFLHELSQKHSRQRSWLAGWKSRSLAAWHIFEFLGLEATANRYEADWQPYSPNARHWPAVDAPPAAWPLERLHEATDLFQRILRAWAEAVRDSGAAFVVLRLPRKGDAPPGASLAEADWQNWLTTILRQEKLESIDATRVLKSADNSTPDRGGQRQLSPADHALLATEVRRWLQERLGGR